MLMVKRNVMARSARKQLFDIATLEAGIESLQQKAGEIQLVIDAMRQAKITRVGVDGAGYLDDAVERADKFIAKLELGFRQAKSERGG